MMGAEEGPTIVIGGGGPVGLALAALLAAGRAPCRICVIEPRPAPRWDAQRTGLRVYALSRASQRLLERLGLWEAVVSRRAGPYERMRVWEGDDPYGPGSIGFDAAEIGEPDLGFIVEDVLLRDELHAKLAESERVRLVEGSAVEAVEMRRDCAVVTLRGGESLQASLVVAADGADSPIRAHLDLPVAARGYGQHALVAHVVSEKPHGHTAWQRFLPAGPLALLPLADGRCSVVWSLPSGRAASLASASEPAFLAALEEAAGRVLGRLGPAGERAAFPLQALHAVRYCCSRGVLVGDAAHVVHPLAGQGMNLGLADARVLAAEIEAAFAEGRDPGDLRVLRRYERRRKTDNLEMLLALDGLHYLFRLPGWAGPLRRAGLAAVDAAAPAKHLLMRRALGLHLEREAARGRSRGAAA